MATFDDLDETGRSLEDNRNFVKHFGRSSVDKKLFQ
jgi:hypothetical protein